VRPSPRKVTLTKEGGARPGKKDNTEFSRTISKRTTNLPPWGRAKKERDPGKVTRRLEENRCQSGHHTIIKLSEEKNDGVHDSPNCLRKKKRTQNIPKRRKRETQ